MTMATVRVCPRPYILYRNGHEYLLTSEEAQRLLDAYPATVRGNVAYLKDDKIVATLSPATLGGGPAFRVYRTRR